VPAFLFVAPFYFAVHLAPPARTNFASFYGCIVTARGRAVVTKTDLTVVSDAFEAARSGYRAAYKEYRQARQRVAQKLRAGLIPSAEEVEQEAKATEHLAVARRELLDVITRLAPPRS
jgi:hypothetical protein